MFKVPEEYRITKHRVLGSDSSYGNNGAFMIPILTNSEKVHALAIASNAHGWEHVSVHILEDNEPQTPTWEEMCLIKSIFWDEDDCVVQYHPPKSDYVNCHPNVLHLWRPIGEEIKRPPKENGLT